MNRNINCCVIVKYNNVHTEGKALISTQSLVKAERLSEGNCGFLLRDTNSALVCSLCLLSIENEERLVVWENSCVLC